MTVRRDVWIGSMLIVTIILSLLLFARPIANTFCGMIEFYGGHPQSLGVYSLGCDWMQP